MTSLGSPAVVPVLRLLPTAVVYSSSLELRSLTKNVWAWSGTTAGTENGSRERAVSAVVPAVRNSIR